MVNQAKEVMLGLFGILGSIASDNGHTIKSVTVSVADTDLNRGRIVGNVTVANRSRRAFTVQVVGSEVEVSLLGRTVKVAA